MNRIVVTGMGVISALGNTVETNHNALVKGTCGLTSLELFKTKYATTRRFGEIKIETRILKDILKATEASATRTDLLALHAFNEAIESASLNESDLQSSHTALVVASTVGGMCLTDELFHDSNHPAAESHFLSSYDCAAAALYLQQKSGIGGIVNTINTACSSAANAIMFGARLIKNDLAKRVIVGGADSLAKFTINGFNSLNILAPQNCKPFDKDRNGLNLGEGAAFLVLEREEDAQDKKIYGVLSGFANANDAFHPSALSENGDGPCQAMNEALDMAVISPHEIDFISAHGTGTENNDEVESRAMKKVFTQPPLFASTKSKVGHTLGAAAAIETVFSLLALNNGEVYPSLNFSEPIAATGLIPVTELKKQHIRNVMINSFGFGGNCSSLIFSNPRS